MPSILKELELGELSLVDNPANPLAKAPLYKRHSEEDIDMDEDIKKMSDKMRERMKYYMEEKGMSEEEARKACMREMEKAWDLADENERLVKFLEDNDFVIDGDKIEKKAPMETIEINGEVVNKADIPAPVLKALEEAEVAKRDVELTKRAQEELPHWDEAVAKEILKFDLDEKILEALKAADAAFEAAMAEAGETKKAEEMGSPEDQLEALAKAYQADKKVTYEKAYADVVKTEEGKALLKAMKKED